MRKAGWPEPSSLARINRQGNFRTVAFVDAVRPRADRGSPEETLGGREEAEGVGLPVVGCSKRPGPTGMLPDAARPHDGSSNVLGLVVIRPALAAREDRCTVHHHRSDRPAAVNDGRPPYAVGASRSFTSTLTRCGADPRPHTSKRGMENHECLEAELLVEVRQTEAAFQGAYNRCQERRTGTLEEC
jgi:hypothetical protein